MPIINQTIKPVTAQLQQSITTAVQSSATNDLPIVQAFLANEQQYFDTLDADFTDLASQLTSPDRIAAALEIQERLRGALTLINALVTDTDNAQNETPFS